MIYPHISKHRKHAKPPLISLAAPLPKQKASAKAKCFRNHQKSLTPPKAVTFPPRTSWGPWSAEGLWGIHVVSPPPTWIGQGTRMSPTRSPGCPGILRHTTGSGSPRCFAGLLVSFLLELPINNSFLWMSWQPFPHVAPPRGSKIWQIRKPSDTSWTICPPMLVWEANGKWKLVTFWKIDIFYQCMEYGIAVMAPEVMVIWPPICIYIYTSPGKIQNSPTYELGEPPYDMRLSPLCNNQSTFTWNDWNV